MLTMPVAAAAAPSVRIQGVTFSVNGERNDDPGKKSKQKANDNGNHGNAGDDTGDREESNMGGGKGGHSGGDGNINGYSACNGKNGDDGDGRGDGGRCGVMVMPLRTQVRSPFLASSLPHSFLLEETRDHAKGTTCGAHSIFWSLNAFQLALRLLPILPEICW
mmetsp:Transcript_54224/g.168171  ORF Transcript_54224/g.168171 Transcript_54224/m.168171 type:complete len:163 (-) Transcript_54224:2-490(-)